MRAFNGKHRFNPNHSYLSANHHGASLLWTKMIRWKAIRRAAGFANSMQTMWPADAECGGHSVFHIFSINRKHQSEGELPAFFIRFAMGESILVARISHVNRNAIGCMFSVLGQLTAFRSNVFRRPFHGHNIKFYFCFSSFSVCTSESTVANRSSHSLSLSLARPNWKRACVGWNEFRRCCIIYFVCGARARVSTFSTIRLRTLLRMANTYDARGSGYYRFGNCIYAQLLGAHKNRIGISFIPLTWLALVCLCLRACVLRPFAMWRMRWTMYCVRYWSGHKSNGLIVLMCTKYDHKMDQMKYLFIEILWCWSADTNGQIIQ